MHAAQCPAPGAMHHYLAERIAAAGGFIGFAEYMHHALYAPRIGYYTGAARKFGADGDFVTAPEISPLFGRVVARQCAEATQAFATPQILELGAGSGALARSVLDWFAERDLRVRYSILEVSPSLVALQRQELASHADRHRIEWLGALPVEGFRGVILANEVIDALPVERFVVRAGEVLQVGVTCTDGHLQLSERAAPDALRDAVRALEHEIGAGFADGYCSEVCLALSPWIADIAGVLEQGLLLFADYGLSRRDYYSTERTNGTLMCHSRHRAHDDVLFRPGEQDLTAWVDFTALAEAGVAAGLGLAGYCAQAQFLLGAGLAEEYETANADDPAGQLRRSAQLKTLTLPGEMGERFRFMAFNRGSIGPLSGFRFQDLRRTL